MKGTQQGLDKRAVVKRKIAFTQRDRGLTAFCGKKIKILPNCSISRSISP